MKKPILFQEQNRHFNKQAHRGGRGLMPENTLQAFLNAIDYDAALEMDLQISKDREIVVSHDAYFNSLFCLDPNGNSIPTEKEKELLIYQMTYDEIIHYDCGSKPHQNFPQQKNVPAVKPLLKELISEVEAYAETKKKLNYYNIELKTKPEWDGKHYLSFEEYVDISLEIVLGNEIDSRSIIQSFDPRAIERVHEKWPHVKTSFLVEEYDRKPNYQDYFKRLNYTPNIFGPNYKLCTPQLIQYFHDRDVRVIPWTPNTIKEMKYLIRMGVDGLITDYPNLFLQLSCKIL